MAFPTEQIDYVLYSGKSDDFFFPANSLFVAVVVASTPNLRFVGNGAAGGRWTLDWAGMEAAMEEHPEVALFMLCNPYNPVGEVKIQKIGSALTWEHTRGTGAVTGAVMLSAM